MSRKGLGQFGYQVVLGSVLVIFGYFILFASQGFAQQMTQPDSKATNDAKQPKRDPLEVFLAQYIDHAGLPGGVIGIGYPDGKDRFAAVGYADVKPNRRLTKDNRFYIGSLTKMMTSVVVLQLVAEKRLRLSDTIASFLPDKYVQSIANAKTATIRDLLRNSSGIPDYLDGEFFFELVGRDPKHGWHDQDVLPLIADRPAKFKPGTKYDPSNSNFILLGIAIEKIEAENLERVFTRRIFEPAEMNETSFGQFPRPADLARGFDDADNDGQLEDVTEYDVGDKLTDGGIVSTAGDLIRFARALFLDHVLLGPNALSRATTDTLFAGDGSYGYGLMIGSSDWGPVWGHDGVYFGYSAEFSWFPKQKTAVVFLSNGRPLNEVPSVTSLLMTGLFGKPQ